MQDKEIVSKESEHCPRLDRGHRRAHDDEDPDLKVEKPPSLKTVSYEGDAEDDDDGEVLDFEDEFVQSGSS